MNKRRSRRSGGTWLASGRVGRGDGDGASLASAGRCRGAVDGEDEEKVSRVEEARQCYEYRVQTKQRVKMRRVKAAPGPGWKSQVRFRFSVWLLVLAGGGPPLGWGWGAGVGGLGWWGVIWVARGSNEPRLRTVEGDTGEVVKLENEEQMLSRSKRASITTG